jgi:hypothetical protein
VLLPLGLRVAAKYYPYWGTPYCRPSEQRRLVANGLRRLLLPVLLRVGVLPSAPQLVSPPFYGNIMTVVFEKS